MIQVGAPANIVGYDDIQGQLASARRFAGTEPTDRNYDHGTGDGVNYACLGFDVGDAVFSTWQTPHAMKLNSDLELHFHWSVPTSAAGKKFKLQFDMIEAGVHGTWATVAGSPFTKEVTLAGGEESKHNLDVLDTFTSKNTSVSSLYKVKLSRIAASSDEYGEEVYLDFIDGHYEQDQPRGSREIYVK